MQECVNKNLTLGIEKGLYIPTINRILFLAFTLLEFKELKILRYSRPLIFPFRNCTISTSIITCAASLPQPVDRF